jgi:8-oxo-dGTP pyrophosphatase MutT (NUDIX family)
VAEGVGEGIGQEASEVAGLSQRDLVLAAGGVVHRRTPDGETEVLVIHRPKYDDWSLPKGKLDPGEEAEDAALREVEEETGLRTTLGPELATTEYHDRYGRPKQVRYWTMEVDGGRFRQNKEVDEVRWLPVPAARRLLSYDHDRKVLDRLTREADRL